MLASAISAGLALTGLAVTGTGTGSAAAAGSPAVSRAAGSPAVSRAAGPPAVTRLAGSLAPFIGRTQAIGNAPAAGPLSIQLWLRPRTDAATSFAQAVSTPGSSQFHHYLSPDAYAARFAAPPAEVAAVESWLRASGFTAVSAGPQRSYVQATASTSTINRAFDVQLKLYKSAATVDAGTDALRSNDRPVSLPAALARIVLGVTGLDNAAPAQPQDTRTTATAACSTYYGQHLQAGLPAHFGRTSFPTQVCGYSAKQLRAAYGANLTNTGRGETIAFTEMSPAPPDMLLTLQDYAKVSGLPAPSAQQYTARTVGCATTAKVQEQQAAPGPNVDPEDQMDVEAAYAMAPGADELSVYGDGCGGSDPQIQGLLDAVETVLGGTGRHPLASIVSNSWISDPEGQPASVTDIEHADLLQAAAEGVGMYFASGDGSGVDAPADDPYAIAVGGTTLGIGQAMNRLFETGWSTGLLLPHKGTWLNEPELGAAGGGPSALWKQPAYQRGVVPAALARSPGHAGAYRSVPDISADADQLTAMAVGLLDIEPGQQPRFYLTPGGGTSQATPLVAGLVADAQQGMKVPFGFLNPVLYRLAGTSALHDARPLTSASPSLYRGTTCDAALCGVEELAVFDDQSNAITSQVTLRGYDNMSGLGTPAGQYFINALRALAK